MTRSELEDYRELIQKLFGSLSREQRRAVITAVMSPQERLAGLTPEERLAGLAPQERLALLDELLRSLPEDYVRTLPPAMQEEIGRRLTSARR